MRSLQRLGTPYLDLVLLHDVEFVASPMWPIPYSGDAARALDDKEGQADWGLLPDKGSKVWGSGDDTVLAAIRELFRMKAEGLVKNIGITGNILASDLSRNTRLMCIEPRLGYPLPTLLRLALLVLHTAPYEPLDVVLSYSHLNLQNSTLIAFAPVFRERALVRQLIRRHH